MMITEHNYEEYFLLYIDDELTSAERKTVADFIDQHPQYASVLIALQETKLPPDTHLSFLTKESLYKDETSDIGISNYEDYFLLYTDNELDEQQKETTERFVLQHPQLQEEFTWLQQTKLAPEVVEYKNKEELYKKERRVLPLYIAGWVAAAVLFAVLLFAGLFTSTKQIGRTYATTPPSRADKPVIQPLQKAVMPDATVNQINKDSQESTTADKTVKNKSEKNEVAVFPEQTNHTNKYQASPTHQGLREDIAVVAPQENTQLLQPATAGNNTILKQVSILKPLDEVETDQTDASTALSLSDNNIAQPAVYKELNMDNDDNHTLYVSGIKLNKNKVNGFLKSASRLLGGRAKQGEE